MYLIALAAEGLAIWDGADPPTRPMNWFVQEALSYESKPGIRNGPTHLHRQMDTENIVFAGRETLSTRAVAAPRGNGLAAHANQNSSQTRIDGTDHQARDWIEDRCRRILSHADGQNHHRPAWRHVPLGEASRAAREGGSTDW